MSLPRRKLSWLLWCACFLGFNFFLAFKVWDSTWETTELPPTRSFKNVASTVGLHQFLTTSPRSREVTKVPNIVHFVFGMERSAVFGLVQYLSVASAHTVLKPRHIYLHCAYLPTGFYWDLVSNITKVRRIKEIHSIFGNPINHYAHKADVARLRALLEFGGIYLDLDVVSLKPFDHLLNNDFVMGQEGIAGIEGLCNAVIIAAKKSKFLQIWYDSYTSFNGSLWNYHSVILPNKLAALYPKDITILNHTTFFWPLWDYKALDIIYGSHKYDYRDNLAVHLWNSQASKNQTKEFSMMWLLQNRSSLLSKLDVYVPTPLFSVIIRCHNQRHVIGNAIASIASQTWPLWEIVVVDDGSSDLCGRYVREEISPSFNINPARPNMKVIVTGKVVGRAQSNNIGISAASGVWICALDADDRVGKNYFIEAEKAISADPDLNIIFSNEKRFGTDEWLWDFSEFGSEKVLEAGPFTGISLYPRKSWDMVGGYSSALPHGVEDEDFMMKLIEAGLRGRIVKGSHTSYEPKLRSMRSGTSNFIRGTSNISAVDHAMLRTRHLTLYCIDSVFVAHRTIGSMPVSTYRLIKDNLRKSSLSQSESSFNLFWLGLYEYRSSNITAAMSMFNSALAVDATSLRWQPTWYIGSLLCLTNDITKGKQILRDTISKYPELEKHQDVQRTVRDCIGFNVTR